MKDIDFHVGSYSDNNHGIPVPNYIDKVSDKVVKIIQSYVGVVNKMVWRKEM